MAIMKDINLNATSINPLLYPKNTHNNIIPIISIVATIIKNINFNELLIWTNIFFIFLKILNTPI